MQASDYQFKIGLCYIMLLTFLHEITDERAVKETETEFLCLLWLIQPETEDESEEERNRNEGIKDWIHSSELQITNKTVLRQASVYTIHSNQRDLGLTRVLVQVT